MSTDYKLPEPTGASKEEVCWFAERVAEMLGYSPGKNLRSVVKKLKGNLEYLPLTEDSKRASITVEKSGEFTIRIFTPIFPLQERMSIAHELGHLFLHSRLGEIPIEAYDDFNKENEVAEDEASWFASAFLMPSEMVKTMADYLDGDTLDLAATFLVPEPVARERMADVCLSHRTTPGNGRGATTPMNAIPSSAFF